MPAGRSSGSSPNKLSAFHLIISSLGVIAGVVLAVYQVMAPSASPPPVNVTVTVDPAKLEKPAAGLDVAKTDPSGGIKSDIALPGQKVDLSGAKFLAALNDGADQKYTLKYLFDGKPETSIALAPPDQEVNILVDFGDGAEQAVAGIAYTPPVSASGVRPATSMDVMVLPDGKITGAGGQVFSFPLQTDQGTQSFALPPGSVGKAVWFRVAGGEGQGNIAIGDLALIKATTP